MSRTGAGQVGKDETSGDLMGTCGDSGESASKVKCMEFTGVFPKVRPGEVALGS